MRRCLLVAMPLIAIWGPASSMTARGQVSAPVAKREFTPDEKHRLAEAERLASQVMSVIRENRLREAIAPAKEILSIRQQVLGAQHRGTAEAARNVGAILKAVGDYSAARPYMEQTLAIARAAFGEKHPNTGAALNDLATLLEALGDYPAARRHYEQALALAREVLGDENLDTASAYNNVGGVLYHQGEFAAARTHYERALAIRRRVQGEEHPATAQTLNNLGLLLFDLGDQAEARRLLERALAIQKKSLGLRHADTALAYNSLGQVLARTCDFAAARACFEQALAIRKEALGQSHPLTASSLLSLGKLLQSTGDFMAARPYVEQALAIRQKVFGREHAETAAALDALGQLLFEMNDAASACTVFEQALAIRQATLGKHHASTAASWANLGASRRVMGDYVAARTCVEQSLALYQQALGDEHADTAAALNNLGELLYAMGDYAAARPCLERSLAIARKVHGRKHSSCAGSLNNLSYLLAEIGDYEHAVNCLAESLTISNDLADDVYATASEAEALNYAASGSHGQHVLISIWPKTARTDDALYAQLWAGRGAIYHVIAGRGRELANLMPGEVQDLYRQWLDSRRELSRLALAPADSDAEQQDARRERRQQASQRKETLERELASRLPSFTRQQALFRRSVGELAQALPQDAVFLDIVRYAQLDHDSDVPGEKGDKWTSCYVAFMVSQGQTVRRIDLGPAQPIEAAVHAWRQAIVSDQPALGSAELGRLLWQPIARALSADIRKVYVAADGHLTNIPWPALPGKRPDTVLLEDYAVAVVPNGQVLLDQLTSATLSDREKVAEGSVLVVGGVQYDLSPAATKSAPLLAGLRAAPSDERTRVPWPDLPGTLAEVDEVERLAGQRPLVRLSGDEASTARVLEQLPQVRYAALATHGFFADPSFRSVFQIDGREFERRQHLMGGERTTVAGRNPLVLSGLVFAGANLPRPKDKWGVPHGDGGILTAEAIAGLQLHNLELAVLSACETGLGDIAGGEGVFGLQRAFHIAGCRNVIASLWKIDDQATQVLMARFYRNLWEKSLPPLESLREAQLAMYYGYEASTGQLSRGQGENVPFNPEAAKRAEPGAKRRAAPRYWAAFMLSGSGR